MVSLNPYYNGRYSWRMWGSYYLLGCLGLNPYYNGRYSWRIEEQQLIQRIRPNPYYNGRYSWSPFNFNKVTCTLSNKSAQLEPQLSLGF